MSRVLALLALAAAAACTDQSPPRTASAAATPPSAATPDAAETPVQPAPAGRGGIELYPAAQLARLSDELATGWTTGRTFGGHPSYGYVQSRRVLTGAPEVHDRWIDVTIVQSGRATLLTGGRVSGGHLASEGEHRGGTIVDGTPHEIAAGDLFVVPAGVPHQFRVARGDSIRYLTLKVLRPPAGP